MEIVGMGRWARRVLGLVSSRLKGNGEKSKGI